MKRFVYDLIRQRSAVALDTAATLADLPAFETSALASLIDQRRSPPPGADLAWLPPPAAGAWLEYADRGCGRIGLLLTEHVRPLLDCTVVGLKPFGSLGRCEIALADTTEISRAEFMRRQGLPASFAAAVAAMLVWIADPATPRRRNPPPFGLARKLRRAGVLPPAGRLPDWTEMQRPAQPATQREAA